MVSIEYPYGLIYKKNSKFLGPTVSEKSAMLISSYHRIFLETCVTKEMKFSLHRVSIWVNIQKNFKFLGRTVSENSALLISRYHHIFLKNCVNEEHEIWFA